MTDVPPRVSVVMATFNGDRYVRVQLESILGQTRLPDEIVVSDDGSTDTTLAIVDDIRRRGPAGLSWQVVSHPARLGPAGNFLAGARLATGEVIALADQDDWWAPQKLEILVGALTARPQCLLVHSDAELTDSSGALLGMTVTDSLQMTRGERRGLIAGDGLRQLVRRNLVTGHTLMMRASVVNLAGGIPSGWLHDEWWALVAASHGEVVFLPRRLGHYRQHEVNAVGATRSGWGRLLERFGENQADFRERHRTRHDGVVSFLAGAGDTLPASSRRLLGGRLSHYSWQATLPSSRLGRLGPIILRLMSGNYHRYRRGVFDGLRDLLQPGSR